MANYIGQGRSNYFAVKDEQAFREDIAKCNVQLIERKTEDGQTLFGFMDNEDGDGLDTWYAWSAGAFDNEDEEEPEVTWGEFFQKHLADDWVAVILNIGSEKYRFLNGEATAYNNKGEDKHLDINNFITHFSGLGKHLAPASY
jgi:hypothetical protein